MDHIWPHGPQKWGFGVYGMLTIKVRTLSPTRNPYCLFGFWGLYRRNQPGSCTEYMSYINNKMTICTILYVLHRIVNVYHEMNWNHIMNIFQQQSTLTLNQVAQHASNAENPWFQYSSTPPHIGFQLLPASPFNVHHLRFHSASEIILIQTKKPT